MNDMSMPAEAKSEAATGRANFIRATTFLGHKRVRIAMGIDGAEIGWIDHDLAQIDALIALLQERRAEIAG